MQISTIYWPQSSPTDSAGLISSFSAVLETISKSAPQSGQVTISPTTASSGAFISAPQSLHSIFKSILLHHLSDTILFAMAFAIIDCNPHNSTKPLARR